MPKRILIIDDDAPVGGAVKKVLEESDYAVELAADGEQGLNCLKQTGFDLLLLDLNLPKLSGFDILDLAAQHYPSLPVVILTGQLEHCEPGALDMADDLVEKPPDVSLLLKTVARLLSQSPEARLRRLSQSQSPGRPLPGFFEGPSTSLLTGGSLFRSK